MSRPYQNPLAPKSAGVIDCARSIKAWTREILDLDRSVVVSVNELACHLPGCPPRETVILVMTGPRETRQLSIHKSIVDVRRGDICDVVGIAGDFSRSE